LLEEERNSGSQALIANLIRFSIGSCLINLYEFIKNPQNTPPFMAWMNAVRGKEDAIPFLAFQRSPAF